MISFFVLHMLNLPKVLRVLTMINVYDASGSGGTKKISGACDVSSVVKVLPNVTSRSFG